jgi:hypothetical protein
MFLIVDTRTRTRSQCRSLVLSIVRAHVCLTYEILLIVLCFIELDLMWTSIEERVHPGDDTLGEEQLRINMVGDGTDTNMCRLVRTTA